MLWFIAAATIITLVSLVLPHARRAFAVNSRTNIFLANREPMSATEFAAAYFPNEIEIAKAIHEILADNLTIEVSRIRPDDRLIAELSLGQIDALDVSHLVHDLDDRFGVSFISAFSQHDPTVRDLVERASAKN